MKKIYFVTIFALLLVIAPFKTKAIVENPLTKLEVETRQGTGNFNLSGGEKSFSFSLTSPFSYANIIAQASDASYTITGAGKVECKQGTNTINVVVTDPSDNSSVTYTINLNFNQSNASSVPVQKSTDNGTTSDENPKTGATINYTFISLAFIGGTLLLIKSKKANKLF